VVAPETPRFAKTAVAAWRSLSSVEIMQVVTYMHIGRKASGD
jgi:hypothetical protein